MRFSVAKGTHCQAWWPEFDSWGPTCEDESWLPQAVLWSPHTYPNMPIVYIVYIYIQNLKNSLGTVLRQNGRFHLYCTPGTALPEYWELWAPWFLDSSWFHSLYCEDSQPLCAALVELGYSMNFYVLPLPWWGCWPLLFPWCSANDSSSQLLLHSDPTFVLAALTSPSGSPGWESRSEGSGEEEVSWDGWWWRSHNVRALNATWKWVKL